MARHWASGRRKARRCMKRQDFCGAFLRRKGLLFLSLEYTLIKKAPASNQKGEETIWICRNCGHVHAGKEAPKVCPVCTHPQSYFEVRKENY